MARKKRIKREIVVELLFLLFLFCFYLAWARIQPLSASPDEKMRYDIAQYIYENGSLPLGDDPAVRDPRWGISYAYSPILSYIISAGFMKAVSFISTQPFALLMAARLVSVLCGVAAGFFVIRIGKKLFSSYKAWLFTVLVTLLPGAVFVYSYVNTDSMALLSGAIMVYCWIMGVEKNWSIKWCILLAVGVSLCALSYYNAYGFVLCSIVIFGSSLLIYCQSRKDYKPFVQKGMLVTLLVLALISWWFIRNYMLYDGDFLGRNASAICAEKYAEKGFKPSDKSTPLAEGITLYEMLFGGFKTNTMAWVELVARSFIGRFGNLDVCLPSFLEDGYLDFLKAGLFLVLIHPVQTFAVRLKGKWQTKGIFHWAMLAAMVIPNILNIYYSYASDYQPQGRYSLPMLVPLMYFVVMGYGNLFDELVKKEQVRHGIYVFLTILAIGVSIYAYLGIFWPEYMNIPFSVTGFLYGT